MSSHSTEARAGADDIVSNEDGSVDVTTSPEAFHQVQEAFEQAGLVVRVVSGASSEDEPGYTGLTPLGG